LKDLSGRTLLTKNMNNFNKNSEVHIKDITAGMYLFEILINKETIIKKIIIH
jgi:hypothetical protein